jgi:hypothetical protein
MSELTVGAQRAISPAVASFVDEHIFKQLWRGAQALAESQLVPAHFRGKPNDCFIALHMASRMGADPVMVLQNLYVVHGTPGWSAKFIIAQANLSGVFKGRIKFRYAGEELADVNRSTLKVTAYATMDDGSDDVVEAVASMDMARLEGWSKNSKYAGLQRQMLSYRAATLLVRLYAPEVLMGVPVVDEIEDVRAAQGSTPVATELKSYSPAELNALLKAPAPVQESVAGTAHAEPEAAEPEPEAAEPVEGRPTQQLNYPQLIKLIERAETVEDLDFARSCAEHLDAPMRKRLADMARERLKVIAPE